jgi:hypothetical protein
MPSRLLLGCLGCLGCLVLATAAEGQLVTREARRPPTTAGSPAGERLESRGAFTRLSSGNQKIATALFEAQAAPAPVVDLDDMAALRQAGATWTEIFQLLKDRGQLRGASLADVLTAHERDEARMPVATAVLPAANTGALPPPDLEAPTSRTRLRSATGAGRTLANRRPARRAR